MPEMRLTPPLPVRGAMVPRMMRVKRVVRELPDIVTFHLDADDTGGFPLAPGRFNMLSLFGTGEVPTPQDDQEVCQAIRAQIREAYGDGAADGVRILYGGSVKAANVAGIMAEADVDGCLVGGASLQADEFGGIRRYHDMPTL